MRGEYRGFHRAQQGAVGTTSACAENTTKQGGHQGARGNYLRVRGEYYRPNVITLNLGELPPRARRILGRRHPHPTEQGTTSACAENTVICWLTASTSRNYLRVRGEYGEEYYFSLLAVELPPRARRIRKQFRLRQTQTGTTSACAENTGFHHGEF